MSDPSNNPFIGNPFAQGVDKQKRTPPPPAPTAQNPKRSEAGLNKSTTRPPRHPQSPAQGSQSPPSQPSATRGRPPSTASTSATTANSNTQNSHSSTATPATKSTKKTPKKLRRSKAQTTSSPQPAVPLDHRQPTVVLAIKFRCWPRSPSQRTPISPVETTSGLPYIPSFPGWETAFLITACILEWMPFSCTKIQPLVGAQILKCPTIPEDDKETAPTRFQRHGHTAHGV
jgi:hypothetical protein